MKIVTVEQMQAIENSADARGLSYNQMMINAGTGVANWMMSNLPVQSGVVGLIGSGNNGGDALIALTLLSKKGVRTIGFLLKQRNDDPLIADYLNYGGEIIDISKGENLSYLSAFLDRGGIVLDGILGTGLKLPLRGQLYEVMARVSHLVDNVSRTSIIAVDCPSGVDCDTGEASDVAIKADHTLVMAAMKQGLLKHPARSLSGSFHLIEIGIENLKDHIDADLPIMIEKNLVRQFLPERPDEGHKGTFGTCLVIAGSTPYTGAAYLTGKAAYRAGCGLVHMAVLENVYQRLSSRLIEAVWTILPESGVLYDPQGAKQLMDVLQTVDSVVLGPGWGLGDGNAVFLANMLDLLPSDLPVLFDADGLKLLQRIDEWWTRVPEESVLTPHPGEMSTLTGLSIEEIQADRWNITRMYAKRWSVNLMLKGAITVIATPDGRLFINPFSDPALGTAGSGDVLSGLIGGLMAQGVEPLMATVSGAWLHAKAGEFASIRIGTDISVTAVDILENLPGAFVKANKVGF